MSVTRTTFSCRPERVRPALGAALAVHGVDEARLVSAEDARRFASDPWEVGGEAVAEGSEEGPYMLTSEAGVAMAQRGNGSECAAKEDGTSTGMLTGLYGPPLPSPRAAESPEGPAIGEPGSVAGARTSPSRPRPFAASRSG